MSDQILPLTKLMDPADFTHFSPEILKRVDDSFTREREQHPARRWEYAMALTAYEAWCERTKQLAWKMIYDVGGAGSPFAYMLSYARTDIEVIDPELPPPHGKTLAQHLILNRGGFGDAVFCLSVLEHVEDLDQFLYHLSCLVRPGGLLFLTVDAASVDAPDQCHFHWMRKRIFGAGARFGLVQTLRQEHCEPFGRIDPEWHGAHVYDYSFASFAFVKEL